MTRALSYAMFIGAMLIFGTIGIFCRYIPLSSGVLACARGALGALVLFLFAVVRGKKLRRGIGIRRFLLLALSGAMIGFNWIFLFEAYHYTSVSVVTLCYYMQPTITILLSPLVFREKLTRRKVLCVLLSLVGMALVSGVFSGKSLAFSDLLGMFFGLSAALFYTGIVILNKKVPVEDAYEKTVIQLSAAALTLVPYVLLTEDLGHIDLTPTSLLLVLVVGVVHTGIAYALYFAGMKALRAQSVAVLSYIDPVSALLFSAAFLEEKLSPAGALGAVLVIGAAVWSELPTVKNRKSA